MMFNGKYISAVAGLTAFTVLCELYTGTCVATDRQPLSTHQCEALKPHTEIATASGDSFRTEVPIFQVIRPL